MDQNSLWASFDMSYPAISLIRFRLNNPYDPYYNAGGQVAGGYTMMFQQYARMICTEAYVYVTLSRVQETTPPGVDIRMHVWPNKATNHAFAFTAANGNYLVMEQVPGFKTIPFKTRLNDMHPRASYRGKFKMSEWILGGKLQHQDDGLVKYGSPGADRDPHISVGLSMPGYNIACSGWFNQKVLIIYKCYFYDQIIPGF